MFVFFFMQYWLYILQSQVKEAFYTGSSDDPGRRLQHHNAESKGYTRRHRPWKIAYTHPFESKEKALKAEQIVKSWKSKKMIRLLIDGTIDINDYLLCSVEKHSTVRDSIIFATAAHI